MKEVVLGPRRAEPALAFCTDASCRCDGAGMIAERLQECLTILRWSEQDLAEELHVSIVDVSAWLSERRHIPLVVAAWVETLVKAYRATPHLRISSQGKFVCTASIDPAAEIGLPPQKFAELPPASSAELIRISPHPASSGTNGCKMPALPPHSLNGGKHESHAL